MNLHNFAFMHRLCLGSLIALSLGAPPHAAELPQPKLLVTIAIDQFSSDLFTEYRPLYQDGLARLTGGVVYPGGHQSHAATETCPGHSTILTGARPARTGIIANDWYDPQLARKDGERETFTIYCVEQPGAVGSDARKKTISSDSLLVPTLGDRMKTRDANSRVVSISGKDRSAVMLGGHKADLTLWWTDSGFVTYTGKESSIPKEISETLNAKVRNSIAQGVTPKLPPVCASKSRKVDIGAVSVGVLQPTPPKSKRWRATPEMDAFTVGAALAAVKAQSLGQRNATDLLAISLSANDYVGHYFGTEGAEMCAQQVALDQSIGRLLAGLDKAGISYAVALTADHGGVDAPERNKHRGVPSAERIESSLLTVNMNAQLAKELHLEGPVILGGKDFGNDVYLSASIPAEQRAAVLSATYEAYRRHRQVAAVFTKNELIAASPPTGAVDEWTLLERAKASFNPQRSGDLVVLLKPYVALYQEPKNPDSDYVASHGSPWGYDRRVPILFWWQGIAGFEQPTAVETVDIAPTLAKLIDLDIPTNEIDGRALPLTLP